MELIRKLRWVRWEPSLGGNLEAKPDARFFFEIAVGWTWLELERIWGDATAAQGALLEAAALHGDRASALTAAAKTLEPCVRLGNEPLSLDGRAVASVRDYLAAVCDVAGMADVLELLTAIRRLNSVTGAREVFSERSSGGFAGTAPMTAVPAIHQPAAQPFGAPTSEPAFSDGPPAPAPLSPDTSM